IVPALLPALIVRLLVTCNRALASKTNFAAHPAKPRQRSPGWEGVLAMNKWFRAFLPAVSSLMPVLILGIATAAEAQPAAPSKVEGADVAWLLTSSALVLMMTIPGLALFYGGMVRRKNILSTLMQSFFLAALVSIQWVLFGYSLAFAPGSSIVGSLSWLGLDGVSASEPFAGYSATVPHQAYMVYQCM